MVVASFLARMGLAFVLRCSARSAAGMVILCNAISISSTMTTVVQLLRLQHGSFLIMMVRRCKVWCIDSLLVMARRTSLAVPFRELDRHTQILVLICRSLRLKNPLFITTKLEWVILMLINHMVLVLMMARYGLWPIS